MKFDDLFDFWSVVQGNMHWHPRDQEVLFRVPHCFRLECLPSAYSGKLKTAPVVLLFLSPGFSPSDLQDATSEAGQRRYKRQRAGDCPLPSNIEHSEGWEWWRKTVSTFRLTEDATYDAVAREHIAILNIGAYHSETFDDRALLASLPSSRFAIEWAQTVLFPLAEDGKRVVICLRAAHWWGLDRQEIGCVHGKSLFVPKVTPRGHLIAKGDAGLIREQAISAVRAAVQAAASS